MDIREYFQKEQKGFYKIIAKTLTAERRKQLYDAINDWHESELKLLCIADVVGRSEQLVCERMPDPKCRIKNGKVICNGCNKERK
ncbi:MAG: hypothetical protein WC871_03535 [Bacteroidales bacterium]|jgi:hypothetical protein